MFTNVESETLVSEEASGAPSWQRRSSTFSGWHTNVGIRATFRRLKFYIWAFDAALIPSSVRVRIREDNSMGAILGDETVSVSPQLNAASLVTVTFAADISSAQPLWFEMFTNGRTGIYETSSAAYPIGTYAQARYSVDSNVSNPAATTLFSGSIQATQWVQFYSLGSPKVAKLSGTFNRALSSDTYLGKLFNVEFGFSESTSIASALGAAWASENSTFSGWGALCGPQQNFSAVRLYVRPWSTAITRVRVVVKTNDVHGAVLADRTVNVTTEVGVQKLVTVDFGALIENEAAAPLFLEYHCDAKCGAYLLTTTPYPGTVNYWTGTNPSDPGTIFETTARNFAVFFGEATDEIQGFAPTAALAASLNVVPATPASATVQINLPAIIYGLEGIEMNLYFRNFIRASIPLSSLQIDVVCAKGAQYQKFWRVTPTSGDVGTHTFELRVYSNGSLAAVKACSLVIKAKTVGGGATRKVLWIGDSTTANGIAIAEMKRIDANAGLDSNYALSFQGSKTGSASDSASGSQTYAHEAISGWSFGLFNTSGSPFYFAGAFNFATYLSTNSITLASGDWVLIHLGINDNFNYTDDVNLQSGLASQVAILDSWITQMKAITGLRIGILLPIVNPDENGFGLQYGSAQTQWRAERNRQMFCETVLSLYDQRQGEGIFVFPYNAILDGENNFPTTNVPVNALNSAVTFAAANSGVHPANVGYWQMGQAAWTFLKAQES